METLVQQTIILIALSLILTSKAKALGSRLPKEPSKPPTTTTTPVVSQPPTTTLPPSTTLPPPVSSQTDFRRIAQEVGQSVDQKYSSYRELIPQRSDVSTHQVDKCDANLNSAYSFAERIAYSVETRLRSTQAELGYVASYFGLNSNNKTYLANSILSQPLCYHTAESLNFTLAGKRVPGSSTIAKMNEFARRMNLYRQEGLNGNPEGTTKAIKLWSKLFMCLSYTESLTSANTSKSNSVADRYAPSDYRRPAGVLFYEDPYQDAASRLNLGLFQFTPTAGGNVQSCLREWNVFFPSCSVNPKASQVEMIRILGSGYQTFNAFCGVSKVVDMFAVQINTSSEGSTHPLNKKSGGGLKPPAERCVTPHFGSKSYNHFGPLQNGMGNTVDPLLTCALSDN